MNISRIDPPRFTETHKFIVDEAFNRYMNNDELILSLT